MCLARSSAWLEDSQTENQELLPFKLLTKMTSLKEKSLKGLFFDFTGRIGLQGVGFFVSIILARILAPEDFGLLAIITVFINLSAVFLDFGFGTALIQRSEVQESHYASVFYMNVAMGSVLAILLFFAAPFLAKFYGNPQLTNLTRLMSLSFIINSFGIVPRARLRREMNFKIISVTNILAAFVSGVIAIYMAWNGYGVWSLAVQTIINQFLANVLLYFFYRQRIKLRFSIHSIQELWGVGSRIFFNGIIDTLFINADSLIIGKVLNTSILGYYYRARSLENFTFRYTSSTLANVFLPGISSLQTDPERLKQAVIKIFHILSFISFLGCGLLLVTSREIIILLFSAKWEPTVIMFQIIISCGFSSQIFGLFYTTLISTGNVNKYLAINAVNKILLFLNFGVLIAWGINTYLIFFTVIMLITFFMGMFSVTTLLHLGGLLYGQTIKYIFVYCSSIVLIFIIKNIYSINNLYVSFLLTALSFLFIFLFLAWVAKCEGMKLLAAELVKHLRKWGRRNNV
jgi:O-antigen/teichoic acid export membrane protein